MNKSMKEFRNEYRVNNVLTLTNLYPILTFTMVQTLVLTVTITLTVPAPISSCNPGSDPHLEIQS